MSSSPAPASKQTLGIVFLILFIDLIGFSMIFPLFPALLEFYLPAAGEGGGLLGQLTDWLRGLAPGGNEAESLHLTAVLFGGIVGSLYAFLQFLAAPWWGRLSDRIGRRPVLLITVAGIALSYLIWAFSANFWLFLLARMVGGVMAGNLGVATAVVADVTSRENRSKGMAIVGIAFGLGMVTGPAIGGLLSLMNPLDWAPELAKFGIHPFSLAAGGALLLSLINLIWIARAFKETLPQHETPETTEERVPRLAFLSGGAPEVRLTNTVYFLFILSFAGMEFTLTFLAAERFGFGPAKNGFMLLFVGFVLILAQGYLVRKYAAKVGELRMASTGLTITLLSFLGIAFAGNLGWFLGALALMAIGMGLASPTLSALVSLFSPERSQGLSLGLFRSAGSLGRAIGPLAGAGIYFAAGAPIAYTAGGLFLLLPLALAMRLKQPQEANKSSK